MKFRNHYSVVFEKLGSFFVVIALLLIQNVGGFAEEIEDINQSDGLGAAGIAVIVLLGVVALVVGFYSMRWYKTTYTINDAAFVMERNTMNRLKNTIGMKNISNVNIEQNIFEKLVGTCKVKLDTNSLSTANETDVSIVLKKEKAREVQKRIMSMIAGNVQENSSEQNPGERNADGVGMDAMTYDIEADSHDIMMHGICSISLATLWVLIGTIVASVVAVIEFRESLTGSMITIMTNIVVIAGIIFTCIKGLLGGFITYYHFKIARRGDKLHIHYGLLRTFDFTIPVSKINAVIVRQPFIARLLKRYIVEVVNVGMGDDQSEAGAHIVLAASREQLQRYMEQLLPEYADLPLEQIKRQPKGVLVLKAVKTILWSTVLIITAVVVVSFFPDIPHWIPTVAVAALIGWGIIVGICDYHTEGTYFGKNRILIANGCFRRDVTVMQYDDIQYVTLNTNIISRRLGLMKGTAFLLASMINQAQAIPYCRREVMEASMQENLN